jgi:hypothetical protein
MRCPRRFAASSDVAGLEAVGEGHRRLIGMLRVK